MPHDENSPRTGVFGVALRLSFFVLLELVSMVVFSTLLDELFGRLAAGALGVFFAAALANALTVRIYERGRFEDVGMGWTHAANRHILFGAAAGIVSGLAVILVLRAAGLAAWQPAVDAPFQAGKFLWVTTLLLFGAVGEELLFRGYGFQVVMHAAGARWIIPISGLLFGAAHLGNLNSSPVAVINTGLWGIVLGYAYYRAGDLWLPIGLHFGWNWILPLLGANLSGFTIGLAGYSLVPGGPTLWSGGAYGPEASLITTFLTLILLVWLHRARIGSNG